MTTLFSPHPSLSDLIINPVSPRKQLWWASTILLDQLFSILIFIYRRIYFYCFEILVAALLSSFFRWCCDIIQFFFNSRAFSFPLIFIHLCKDHIFLLFFCSILMYFLKQFLVFWAKLFISLLKKYGLLKLRFL